MRAAPVETTDWHAPARFAVFTCLGRTPVSDAFDTGIGALHYLARLRAAPAYAERLRHLARGAAEGNSQATAALRTLWRSLACKTPDTRFTDADRRELARYAARLLEEVQQ